MIRKIIKINEEKCTGCGICADACHEGAIGIVNGKAVLLREDYCDGLGDCLPACPEDAISFEEREAPAYDKEAVQANMAAKRKALSPTQTASSHHIHQGGCPGSKSHTISHDRNAPVNTDMPSISELSQWPVQIKLVPVQAPYFDQADLLVAADCTAFSYGNFHRDFIKNHITLIGCPKLDDADYSEKLSEIICLNDLKSITIARMEVPCCGGMEYAVKTAIAKSGKNLTCRVVVISIDGEILKSEIVSVS